MSHPLEFISRVRNLVTKSWSGTKTQIDGGPSQKRYFMGYVDGVTNESVYGWAWDPLVPDEEIKIDVFQDGKLINSGFANHYRPDLEKEGIGDGRHGFYIQLQPDLRSKQTSIEVRFAQSGDVIRETPQRAFCILPFTTIKITPDGGVNMCCYQTYNPPIGNILKESLSDIWFGQIAEEIRKTTLASKLHERCIGWNACPHINTSLEPVWGFTFPQFPRSLELDLPDTHCNVGGTSPTPDTACFMCARSRPGFTPQEDFTLEIINRIKPFMPWLNRVKILGIAEPFWKDKVFEILNLLDYERYKKRCTFITWTNGTVFTPERQARLIEACPTAEINFSVDAATPETYRAIRRLDLYETVIKNIKNFVRIKKDTHTVNITNNLNLKNLHEAVDMLRQAKGMGVDKIIFNPSHNSGGKDRPGLTEFLVSPSNAHLFRQAQVAVEEEAKRIKMPVVIVRQFDLGLSPESKLN
jgi:MoaA/NifB/PqqE/SkfB family radical SAM enzyme